MGTKIQTFLDIITFPEGFEVETKQIPQADHQKLGLEGKTDYQSWAKAVFKWAQDNNYACGLPVDTNFNVVVFSKIADVTWIQQDIDEKELIAALPNKESDKANLDDPLTWAKIYNVLGT